MEKYLIYKNGNQIDEVIESVDGTLIDVLGKWLNEKEFKGTYKMIEQTEKKPCCAEINDNLYFSIGYVEL
ncbi:MULTISPECIES: hypothetical protein [Bacillaceae]|uniref:hypothetical protein n=1 Tax=Bacillaceae TaxID=186817 RepID=UPI000BFC770C|nr:MULTISPECIES: hypothetical protein [Bacillaceae]MCM3164333.1 hypothetical protein [Metabacillus litoralis]PGT75195.1 hypothetical protein COD11_26115 [Bacillus sp. AFS040349]UGB33726.1 hypothetical protein LPC09_26085 [Metabacillus sp. B2-18]